MLVLLLHDFVNHRPFGRIITKQLIGALAANYVSGYFLPVNDKEYLVYNLPCPDDGEHFTSESYEIKKILGADIAMLRALRKIGAHQAVSFKDMTFHELLGDYIVEAEFDNKTVVG